MFWGIFRTFAAVMRHIAVVLLMAMLTSCLSQHERQVQMLDQLMEATDHYDVMPNDSDARAVLYYMERHGITKAPNHY